MPISPSEPRIENDNGILEIIPGDDIQATSWSSLTFRWKIGMEVEAGGGLEIILVTRFPTNRWSLPQLNDPTAPGYVTAKVSGDAIAALDVLRWPVLYKPHGACLHVIQVGIGGTNLDSGDIIEVTYGDKAGGSLGVQAQMSARVVAFPVFVSSGHGPKFFERFVSWNRETDIATLREMADFNPSIGVVGGKAVKYHVVAPIEVESGTPFDVRFSVLDHSCNAASDYEGRVELSTTDGNAPPIAALNIKGAQGAVTGVKLQTEGFHRIYLVDADHEILGVSNPIRVCRGAKPVFWGELHGHSEQSDGNGTPDEHYSYARDVALLDFACVCDHDSSFYDHPDRWEYASEKVKEYSRPGEFIAFLGYEGRLSDPDDYSPYADINVYYREKEAPIFEAFKVPLTQKAIGAADAILVPHSSLYGPEAGMGTHWEFLEDMPADSIPLVEIFSTHGNSEYYDCPRHVLWQAEGQSVVDALKKGFRLGVIGSSDYHEVLTGNLLKIQDTPRTVNNRHMQARCGLAAVRADGLTREAIYQALKIRRTFATSGIRGYVDFTVNGHNMGSEVELSTGREPRHCKIAAAAPERIVKAEVIRNGTTIAELADGNWFLENEIVDEEPILDNSFYYVRVTTESTEFIWSSPIWIRISP